MNFSDIDFSGKYRVDGLPVPESYYVMKLESRMVGGAFGILETATRMSVRDYSVRLKDGNRSYERFFGSEGDAKNFALRMNQTTVYKNILVDESWLFANTLIPFSIQQSERRFNKKELIQIADDIKLIIDSNPGCQELINSILEKAESPANPIVSKDPVTVFWAVAQRGGIYEKNQESGGVALGSIAKRDINQTLKATIEIAKSRLT